MKNNETEIVEFFREVQRIISKHGLTKVLNQLRRIQVDFGSKFNNDVSDYIVVKTANHYALSKEELLTSKKRNKITEARRMCFALMKEHLPYSDDEIGDYFGGKSRQYVNKQIISLPINQDKFANKHEAKFVNDFMNLSKQIVEYKNEYK